MIKSGQLSPPEECDLHPDLPERTRFTRFGFQPWIEKGATDIVMPDLSWGGGLTESRKIAALPDTHSPAGMSLDCDRYSVADRAPVSSTMLSPAFKSSFEIDWPSTPAAVCAPQMVIGLRDWAGPARVGANWSKGQIFMLVTPWPSRL